MKVDAPVSKLTKHLCQELNYSQWTVEILLQIHIHTHVALKCSVISSGILPLRRLEFTLYLIKACISSLFVVTMFQVHITNLVATPYSNELY